MLDLGGRGDRAAGSRLFTAALVLSLAVHALVLAIHFRFPEVFRRPGASPPLEVVLVNARTESKPVKAELLAQANLDGGGNTETKRRAKSPLPVAPEPAPDIAVEATTQRIEALEQRAQELIALARAQQSPPPPPEQRDRPQAEPVPITREAIRRSLEAVRLEAQIARDLEAYQQQPKRRFVGARAEEYRFARYVEDWRMKVERVGNLNYPDAARQQRLYGSLLLTVAIRSDGTLEAVEVNRPSGAKVLDAAAVRIVELAAPFAPFPADIRSDTDVLYITRTWTFTRADSLVSE